MADDLAADARVLCFDEFFVIDIGDAMILAGLLKALSARGLVLITIVQCPPRRAVWKWLAARTVSASHCPAAKQRTEIVVQRPVVLITDCAA